MKELRIKRRGETLKEALTFSLGDGGGGGDGAEGGAAREGGVGPRHGHRVAHPRCWVNGSDWFICKGGSGKEIRKLLLIVTEKLSVLHLLRGRVK